MGILVLWFPPPALVPTGKALFCSMFIAVKCADRVQEAAV